MNYQLYCDFCGYKRITEGTDVNDLKEIKTSSIQKGIPVLDPIAKKIMSAEIGQPAQVATGIIQPKTMKQKKKFKCPGCGKVIMARKLLENSGEDQEPKINYP